MAVVDPRQARDDSLARQAAWPRPIGSMPIVLAHFAEAVRPTPRAFPEEEAYVFGAILSLDADR